MRFRFRLHETDWPRYGDQWVEFDENALTRLPMAQLREMERQIRAEFGISLARAIYDYPRGYLEAGLAVTWMARRMAGVDERLADYTPSMLLYEVQWLRGGDADPPAETDSPEPTSSPPTKTSKRSSTSGSPGSQR